MTGLWPATLATIAGCYLLKLFGHVVPDAWLDRPAVRRIVRRLPVALLAALVVVELLTDGRALRLDGPRLVGFVAGAVAVWRRAPFLVVVLVAACTAAMLRLVV